MFYPFLMKNKLGFLLVLAAASLASCNHPLEPSTKSSSDAVNTSGSINPSSSNSEDDQIQAIYQLYLKNASEKGEEPLSYEDWLASIKGEKGDKGDKGEAGRGIVSIEKTSSIDNVDIYTITFTDGTTTTFTVTNGKDASESEEANLNLSFNLKEDGTYEVSKGEGFALAEIGIPSKHNGIAVTSIADKGFEKAPIEKIVLPSSITSIGESAFEGCSHLSGVYFPSGSTLKSIGARAFISCSSLQSFIFPESLESIGSQAYEGAGLANVELPDSVTSLGISAFANNTGLTNLKLSNALTRIPNSLVYGCSSLTSLSLPSSINNIGGWVFSKCSKLKTLNYDGTKEDWDKIGKGTDWNDPSYLLKVVFNNLKCEYWGKNGSGPLDSTTKSEWYLCGEGPAFTGGAPWTEASGLYLYTCSYTGSEKGILYSVTFGGGEIFYLTNGTETVGGDKITKALPLVLPSINTELPKFESYEDGTKIRCLMGGTYTVSLNQYGMVSFDGSLIPQIPREPIIC